MVVAVLAALLACGLLRGWHPAAQEQEASAGIVCRIEPYTSERRKKVGYAGDGAVQCLRQLGCTTVLGHDSNKARGHAWHVLWTHKQQASLPCETLNEVPVRTSASLFRLVNHCYHNPVHNIAGTKSSQVGVVLCCVVLCCVVFEVD